MTTLTRFTIGTLVGLLSLNASAATLVGTWLDDSAWSLIHGGATPTATTTAADHLRWDPGQSIVFDLTGTTLTAAGPQVYSLTSNNGAAASFTLQGMSLDLDGPDGFNSGTLSYELNVASGPLAGMYAGTFSFVAMNAPNFPFNSSSTSNGVFELYLWGGDDGSDLGIDIGINAPVPLPAPALLLASGLFGLGLLRRRR